MDPSLTKPSRASARPLARLLSLLLGAVLALAPVLLSVPAHAAATVKLVVTTIDSGTWKVLPDAQVSARLWENSRQRWTFLGSGTTASDGSVSFPDVASGTISFDVSRSGYAATTWMFSTDGTSATGSFAVVVGPLASGSTTVATTVRRPDGAPLPLASVYLDPVAGGSSIVGRTTERGDLSIAKVPAGTYRLRVGEVTAERGGPTLTTWYPGVGESSRAVPVTVPASGTVTLDEWRVLPAAELSGRVRADVEGTMDGTASLLDLDGEVVDKAWVRSDGTYTFTGLRPGKYLLRHDADVKDPATGQYRRLVREWWRDRYEPTSATVVTLRGARVTTLPAVTLSARLSAWRRPSVGRRGAVLTARPGTWSVRQDVRLTYAWRVDGRSAGTGRTARIPAAVLKRVRQGRRAKVVLTVRATHARGLHLPGRATARYTIR